MGIQARLRHDIVSPLFHVDTAAGQGIRWRHELLVGGQPCVGRVSPPTALLWHQRPRRIPCLLAEAPSPAETFLPAVGMSAPMPGMSRPGSSPCQ